jgi:peptidoglycan hydrolase-like amidase
VNYVQDPAPVTATAWQILQYNGAPAFAQFSASNGGWTVYGGQPYLPAKSDPYDTVALSGDPYIGAKQGVRVSSIASYFGLTKVLSISITSRDGHGTWLGRVLAGSVLGTDASGARKTVPATGYDFAWAFGLGTTWLKIEPPAA